jgi:putative copper export protein
MTVDVLAAGLAVIHAVVAAVWLGAMLYSLLVVQPRAGEFFGTPERYEPFAVVLAAGARWKVIGMVATLAVSGGGLVAVEIARAENPSTLWIALVVAKGVLLLAAFALFAHVSWRLWPARIFTPDAELAGVQTRFRTVALTLTGLVSVAFGLGSIAGSLPA